MAIKNSQLYASLWQSCDELRCGMDASQYKDYILTILFLKYVSDKFEQDPYSGINVPEGGSFSDMDKSCPRQILDPYDVYQKLMDYWEDVMQDDVYLITTDGWVKASQPRDIIQEKNLKETPDLTIKKKKYKMDLIPPSLIVARYFADEQTEIDTRQTELVLLDRLQIVSTTLYNFTTEGSLRQKCVRCDDFTLDVKVIKDLS